MFEMVRHSIVLFFQGRLFADPGKVYQRLAIGLVITIAIFIGMSFARIDPRISAGVAGFVGGMLQPHLFRDLRFR